MNKKLNGYELSRGWFDFAFENPEKISPNHAAIYFFAIEHCNRLGWKRKFGFPTQMAMDALGIKKHQTYIRYFSELCEWGFFDLVQKSQNQYSANIISLVSAMPKNGKALDKAIINHTAKQTETNGQSNSPINKPLTNKPINIKQEVGGFDSIFKSFLLMRKELKKPMTEKAIELLKTRLEKLAPKDEQTQIEILEQSIMNNWQGVFPLKNSAKKEGANGTLLKDCQFKVLPFKDIHVVKYRTVVAFYNFFIERAEKLNRKDDLDLLNSADLGVWMYDIDQIEKENQFDTFDFYTIAIYLKEILYDEKLHFDSDSITSLKDLYGNYSNGKSRYLRVSRDAAKYIDKFDKFQLVNILIDKINGQ